MRSFVVRNCMNFIRRNHPEYTEIELEKIEYGLVGGYLLIPKLIIIFVIAHFIGLLSEAATFMFIHMFMKMHTFGLHASKSWICLVISTVVFILAPWLALNAEITFSTKYIIGIIAVSLIYKNSPADTHKKPIINIKKRRIHKLLATLTAIIFVILSVTISNQFMANSFIFSLTIQAFLTSPVIYTIFKLPYNNYLRYSN